jgi:hypothetical protein
MQFLAKVLTCLLACLIEPLGGVVYWPPHHVYMPGYGLVTRTRSGSAMICCDSCHDGLRDSPIEADMW